MDMVKRLLDCVFKKKPFLQVPFFLAIAGAVSLVDMAFDPAIQSLDEMNKLNAELLRIEKIEQRWPYFLIEVEAAADLVKFRKHHLTREELEAVTKVVGRRVWIAYQNEYSILPPFHLRHLRELRESDVPIIEYADMAMSKDPKRVENGLRMLAVAIGLLVALVFVWIVLTCRLSNNHRN